MAEKNPDARAVLFVRTDEGLRQRVEKAAKRAGRSISAEIAHRLRESLKKSARHKRADRREPLVVLPLRLAAEIAAVAERAKAGAP